MVATARFAIYRPTVTLTALRRHARSQNRIIRSVPDFPKPGILFYDIGTLLANGPVWQQTVRTLAGNLAQLQPDALVGIESRGFLAGAAVAAELGIGFIMLRKPGKLPGRTLRHAYALEYGEDALEIQDNVLKPGQRVVICDDLLATGGTAAAAVRLAQQAGAAVLQAAFIVRARLPARARAKLTVPVTSLVSYAD